MRGLLALLLFANFFMPAAAHATWTGYDTFSQLDFSAPAVKNQPIGSRAYAGNPWHGTIGGGGAIVPTYPGSDENEGQAYPLLNLVWKDRAFISTQKGVGFFILRDNVFNFGAALSYEQGRDANADGLPTGFRDINPSLDVGGFLDVRFARIMHFNMDVKTAVTHGGHESTYGNFGLRANVPLRKNLELRTGPSLKWAGSGYVKRYFGVTPAEAAVSGLPRYSVNGGIVSLSYDVGLDYEFAKRWFAEPVARYTYMAGDAGDSPITKDRSQYFAGVFVGYRF